MKEPQVKPTTEGWTPRPHRDMPDYRQQTNRIKDKLGRARTADPALLVFGAPSHRYEIGPPLDEREVAAFEENHLVSLPACFRAFLTQVGNGSPVANHVIVDPQGIYPLTDEDCDAFEKNHGIHTGPSARARLAKIRNSVPFDQGYAARPDHGLYPLPRGGPSSDSRASSTPWSSPRASRLPPGWNVNAAQTRRSSSGEGSWNSAARLRPRECNHRARTGGRARRRNEHGRVGEAAVLPRCQLSRLVRDLARRGPVRFPSECREGPLRLPPSPRSRIQTVGQSTT